MTYIRNTVNTTMFQLFGNEPSFLSLSTICRWCDTLPHRTPALGGAAQQNSCLQGTIRKAKTVQMVAVVSKRPCVRCLQKTLPD